MSEFDTWVAARSPQLARTAYLLTGDLQLAEDLLQDTLSRIAQRWEGLVRRGEPDAYARRVMYHLAVDWWRRRRTRPEIVTGVPLEPPIGADDTDAWTRRIVLREALMRLTPRQRAVLVLRFFDDLSEQQTAQLLRCSVNTVKSQTRHALERIRRLAPDLQELDQPTREVPTP